jgi:hypothetical protein
MMKVELDVEKVTQSLGNHGVVLQIWENDGTYLGKLRVGRAKVEWCAGKTRLGNGKELSLKRLVDLIAEA